MGFKVRGYIREVPQEKVRDYSLFAIATEGTEREPDYFRLFDGIDRIKVDIIEPETSDDEDASEKRKASSPSKVLEKVKAYISKNQLSAEDGDSLWCVIDVDRWPQEQIEELHAFCSQKKNRHLVISNPCIEIWLLYHKRPDLTGLGIHTANDAKQVLDKCEKALPSYNIPHDFQSGSLDLARAYALTAQPKKAQQLIKDNHDLNKQGDIKGGIAAGLGALGIGFLVAGIVFTF